MGLDPMGAKIACRPPVIVLVRLDRAIRLSRAVRTSSREPMVRSGRAMTCYQTLDRQAFPDERAATDPPVEPEDDGEMAGG
jgi:hypothetical protein